MRDEEKITGNKGDKENGSKETEDKRTEDWKQASKPASK
jgi:hypothetical protein